MKQLAPIIIKNNRRVGGKIDAAWHGTLVYSSAILCSALENILRCKTSRMAEQIDESYADDPIDVDDQVWFLWCRYLLYFEGVL